MTVKLDFFYNYVRGQICLDIGIISIELKGSKRVNRYEHRISSLFMCNVNP